jgi:hypothetical protein
MSLTIVANATYSGYYLNGRVYPGKYVKAGTPTWVDAEHGGVSPYNAPVLKHHDSRSDPIGRVVHAEYQHILHGDAWENDWRTPVTGLDKGSGFIRLTANITDEAEIQRFLDGRHKTLSTTSRSQSLTCSICGVNIMKDGFCGHRPGEMYEPEKKSPLGQSDTPVMAYFITGPKTYAEVSVVTHPAQPHAVVDTIKIISDAQMKNTLDNIMYEGRVDIPGNNLSLIIRDDLSGNIVPLTRKPDQRDAIPDGSMRAKVQVAIPEPKVVSTPNADESGAGVAKASPSSNSTENNHMSQENKTATIVDTTSVVAAKPDAKDTSERTLTALSDQLADLRDNNKLLQADRDAKDAELTRVLNEIVGLKDQLHKANCLRLACMRALTVREVDGKKLDSVASVKAYADTLAPRTPNSIADALNDEESPFGARLKITTGLPAFVKDAAPAEPAVQVREVAEPEKKDSTLQTPGFDI